MMLEVVDTPAVTRAPGGTDDEKRAAREADAALLRAVATGNARAFAQLYEAHRRPLFRLAYGVLLDAHDAREAVQEAFLRLHQAAPLWQPDAAVGTWLYRVVLNHCLSLKQRLRRFARPALERRRAPTPETRAALGEALRIVERSLGELPLRQRAVACLFLDGGLAPSEIAHLVELTPNNARVTLHRALERLRADLRDAGIETATSDEEDFLDREET